MLKLKGDRIYLRALEPSDLEFLYHLENDTTFWEISGTTTPYSRSVLKLYLENAHLDIYEVKQLRLCICDLDHTVLGLIDLFDFDPKNHRAGLGIVIQDSKNRNKGIGADAIELVCKYGFSVLNLKQVYANVSENNKVSMHVFEKLGFERVGVKKNWLYTERGYMNEVLYQKIK